MKVLFICKANVGRSQMATAFFNRMFKKHRAIGAGTHVGENEGKPIHEFVVNCMAELGYNLSKNTRKQLTPEMVEEADKIVVMNDKEDLPDYVKNSPKVIYWEVEDGRGKSYEFHCQSRDQIKSLVEKLVKEME